MKGLEPLKQHVYAPYSGDSSICVVRSTAGCYFPGVRIENASFPLTISAVQSALFCCLSEGQKPAQIFTDSEDKNNLPFWIREYEIGHSSIADLGATDFYKIFWDTAGDDVLTTLRQLHDHSVTIHSHFPVSALLETDRGFVSGVNIECSEWNMGLCAERVALGKAITYGCKKINVLHIHARKGEFGSPCGACRQVILEHLPHHPVHLYHSDGSKSVHFSSDLLPYSFKSDTLQQPQPK